MAGASEQRVGLVIGWSARARVAGGEIGKTDLFTQGLRSQGNWRFYSKMGNQCMVMSRGVD